MHILLVQIVVCMVQLYVLYLNFILFPLEEDCHCPRIQPDNGVIQEHVLFNAS